MIGSFPVAFLFLLATLLIALGLGAPDCDPRSPFVPLGKPFTSSFADAQLLCIDTRNHTFSAIGLQIVDIQWAAPPIPLCTVWVTHDFVSFQQLANQSINFACNQTVGSSFYQGSVVATSKLWYYPKTISMAAVVPQDCVLSGQPWNCMPQNQLPTQITLTVAGRGPLY